MVGQGIWFPPAPRIKEVQAGFEHPFPVQMAGSSSSMFGEVRVVERTPIIELKSTYGTSAIRDITTTANNGTITSSGGLIVLSTSATANGSAVLESTRQGRYLPGYSAQVGIGVEIDTDATGNQVGFWGARDLDGDNGFYFGQDATGLFVVRKTGGTEQARIYRSSWNGDKADGTGPTKATLDLTRGAIFQIDFSWYSFGLIVFKVVIGVGLVQREVILHTMDVNGPSTENPNFALYAEVDNGGDEADYQIKVGGRQFSIEGKYEADYRFGGQDFSGVSTGTTAVPLVSIRHKSAFYNRTVLADHITAIPATEAVVIEVRLNGTLTGTPSWGTPTNHTAAETAMEVDTSASGITGGVVIWSDLFDAGQANKGQLGQDDLIVDIPPGQNCSLCARTQSGTGTIKGHFRWKEDW